MVDANNKELSVECNLLGDGLIMLNEIMES